MAQIARGGFGRDEAALDLHQPLGQGLVVAAGEAGEDQLARNARRRAGNDNGAGLQLPMWARASRSETGRVAGVARPLLKCFNDMA